ncbi:MAG: hypothetical protein UT26_C0032G0007 [Microgenomates group bacterium GW2011_GWC1_39_12]|nr:MAG: hypothetical protein UT26_C0032G0007 [Microgenomates group bacterium GW2011_GWC1_39_12]
MKREYLKKGREAINNHLVDSTAILTESTPLFAAFETLAVGMSPEVSMNTRMIAAGSAYAGLGYIYGKGRDISRRLFRVTDKTSERYQHLHDSLYSGAFNLVLAPTIYFFAGEKDISKIAVGTACAIGLGSVNGGPIGYSIDLFRDLTGIKKSERIPKILRRQNSKVKKSLVALLVGGAIATTTGIYGLTADKKRDYQEPIAIVEKYENSEGVKESNLENELNYQTGGN